MSDLCDRICVVFTTDNIAGVKNDGMETDGLHQYGLITALPRIYPANSLSIAIN